MKFSIVVPVYNEPILIKRCLRAMRHLEYTASKVEIVIVNDGSTDQTKMIAAHELDALNKRGFKCKLINIKKNRGWIYARRQGAQHATWSNIVFTDARCALHPDVLEQVKSIGYTPIVGNPLLAPERSIPDRVNYLIKKKIHGKYIGSRFAPIMITPQNFSKIGKGTTIFICKRSLFLRNIPKKSNRFVSDDIRLLWNIVQEKDILKHPDVQITYAARETIQSEISHLYHRGPKFVDYYMERKGGLFLIFIIIPAILTVLLLMAIILNQEVLISLLAFLSLTVFLVSVWMSEKPADLLILPAYGVIYGLAFEVGICRGIIKMMEEKT